ncbi:putative serine/threonine protein kinase RTK1 KNAG_0K01710 [Huiozyma naganishii CBS 8797]|uniref:Protein kinase domain-containing protein n=1 Tax=Huiozyma naganishii (strain ATCC MYA-139 / BCRC 22969 / CBS 8797 / KCTC 17520 / NBRC 10181 / NCYC 3082 / Yp74L-3) TaxID=1071383 RepID=J7SAX2_HUIN7|nr:hypothetical protein KNAG_0K01710 [Kazachstania naganishii CBS 8797]CCK72536.1 hypothetical protein KNAG_0K01710 [Kazachstania naganishii CBS 8797]
MEPKYNYNQQSVQLQPSKSLSSIFGGNTKFKSLAAANFISENGIKSGLASRHSNSQTSIADTFSDAWPAVDSIVEGETRQDHSKLHPAQKVQRKLEGLYIPLEEYTEGPAVEHHHHGIFKMGTHLLKKLGTAATDVGRTNHHEGSARKTEGPRLDKIKFLDKYEILNKVIGEGATGSVQVIREQATGTLYAMKVFRPQQVVLESKHAYRRHLQKIIQEFSIGVVLHHENVIKTVDLLIDNDVNHVSVLVLEYVPYDFFNLVMSGQMTVEESNCYFKQLASTIQYLHKNGIAHRDLKLDNLVVTDQGILKLLDFGSAFIFKAQGQGGVEKCLGIVGSDPYLSPELLETTYKKYDPRPVDVWACAIIYYCMIMGKFPWKAPRKSFNSFRLFSEDPDDEADVSKGPLRLLRVLPKESQHIIAGMLLLSPKTRATVEEVLEDPWVRSIHRCRAGHNNEDTIAHVHHLVTEEGLEELKRTEKDVHAFHHLHINNTASRQLSM